MEPTSIALTQISILVNNLNKKNICQSVESARQVRFLNEITNKKQTKNKKKFKEKNCEIGVSSQW